MAYLLYFNNQLIGCYGTVELLRANILIMLFELLNLNQISTNEYENLSDYLKVEDFSEDNLTIPELKTKLRNLQFHVQSVDHEGSGGCALERVLEHIKYRFGQLDEIMEKDVRITVKFPGPNVKEHLLGKPYYDQWRLFDRKNWSKITNALHDYIAKKITKLMEKYNERVEFGDVLYENASDISYQVWSANAVNWNLPAGSKIPGKFQAEEVKFQDKGVFGIVVTPMYGYKNLIP